MFWVPQSGDIGMGVSIMSYAGDVQFGLITDRGLCPDPERVIERFAPEFEKLRAGDADGAVAVATPSSIRAREAIERLAHWRKKRLVYSSSDCASSTSSRSIASAGLHFAACS